MVMVRATIASLLLVHTLLGCCWHHAHECTPAVALGSLSCPFVHDRLPSTDEPCGDSQHEHRCLEDRCVLIRGDLSRTPVRTIGAPCVFALVLSPPEGATIPAAAHRLEFAGVAGSVRVHMLHQVLLI